MAKLKLIGFQIAFLAVGAYLFAAGYRAVYLGGTFPSKVGGLVLDEARIPGLIWMGLGALCALIFAFWIRDEHREPAHRLWLPVLTKKCLPILAGTSLPWTAKA
ncbi:MAG TPA: hypothetical protein VK934_03640 [Fimbriimonas sp.]|nr:hypothetical protein [Fimbriimonas sp.]